MPLGKKETTQDLYDEFFSSESKAIDFIKTIYEDGFSMDYGNLSRKKYIEALNQAEKKDFWDLVQIMREEIKTWKESDLEGLDIVEKAIVDSIQNGIKVNTEPFKDMEISSEITYSDKLPHDDKVISTISQILRDNRYSGFEVKEEDGKVKIKGKLLGIDSALSLLRKHGFNFSKLNHNTLILNEDKIMNEAYDKRYPDVEDELETYRGIPLQGTHVDVQNYRHDDWHPQIEWHPMDPKNPEEEHPDLWDDWSYDLDSVKVKIDGYLDKKKLEESLNSIMTKIYHSIDLEPEDIVNVLTGKEKVNPQYLAELEMLVKLAKGKSIDELINGPEAKDIGADLIEILIEAKQMLEAMKLKESKMSKVTHFYKSKLNEGTWAVPKTASKAKKLINIIKNSMGKSSKDLKNNLYNIFGDDELFDELDAADYEFGPTNEFVIKTHLKRFLRKYPEYFSKEAKLILDNYLNGVDESLNESKGDFFLEGDTHIIYFKDKDKNIIKRVVLRNSDKDDVKVTFNNYLKIYPEIEYAEVTEKDGNQYKINKSELLKEDYPDSVTDTLVDKYSLSYYPAKHNRIKSEIINLTGNVDIAQDVVDRLRMDYKKLNESEGNDEEFLNFEFEIADKLVKLAKRKGKELTDDLALNLVNKFLENSSSVWTEYTIYKNIDWDKKDLKLPLIESSNINNLIDVTKDIYNKAKDDIIRTIIDQNNIKILKDTNNNFWIDKSKSYYFAGYDVHAIKEEIKRQYPNSKYKGYIKNELPIIKKEADARIVEIIKQFKKVLGDTMKDLTSDKIDPTAQDSFTGGPLYLTDTEIEVEEKINTNYFWDKLRKESEKENIHMSVLENEGKFGDSILYYVGLKTLNKDIDESYPRTPDQFTDNEYIEYLINSKGWSEKEAIKFVKGYAWDNKLDENIRQKDGYTIYNDVTYKWKDDTSSDMEYQSFVSGLKDNLMEITSENLQYFALQFYAQPDGLELEVDYQDPEIRLGKNDYPFEDVFTGDVLEYIEEEDRKFFDSVNKQMKEELNDVEKNILPRVAKEWGFRKQR